MIELASGYVVGLMVFLGIVGTPLVASNKHRSVGGWLLAGIIFGLFAFVIVLLLPPLADPDCKISLILSRSHTHPLALFHTSWAGFFTRAGLIRRRYHTSWADPHAADRRGEGNDTSSTAVGRSGAG